MRGRRQRVIRACMRRRNCRTHMHAAVAIGEQARRMSNGDVGHAAVKGWRRMGRMSHWTAGSRNHHLPV